MRNTLPLIRDISIAYRASLAIAAVVTVVSVAGLSFGTAGLYGDQTNLFGAFLGQDLLNLVVGVPALLGAMWLSRRGWLIGLLLWPGALFYVLYDYGFYVLGAPMNALFLAYLLLVTASAYTLMVVLSATDANAVRAQLAEIVPARITGGVLVTLALLFTALWSFVILSTAFGAPADPIARVVVTLDLTIQLPALLLGGIMLWRRRAIGYVAATGLLFQATAYLLGLSAICLLGTSPTGNPVTVIDWAPGLMVGAIGIVLIGTVVPRAGPRPSR